MKTVVPIIVVTWILSLVSAVAIMYMLPNLVPLRSEQIGEGMITSDKIADQTITSDKIADQTITSDKIADGTIVAADIADGTITAADILDRTITAADMASSGIPHSVVCVNETAMELRQRHTNWTDMNGMKVDITIERKSRLVIMFSGQFLAGGVFVDFTYDARVIYVRAMVGEKRANPQMDDLWFASQVGRTTWQSQSFIFYSEILEPGTHTVKIQWRIDEVVNDGGRVASRTLVVIALPE